MLTDASSVPQGTRVSCDVCVIGAGAAGISVAIELDGSPLRTVLLESGRMQPDQATQDLYAGEGAGIPYFTLDGSRIRFFGGTTNHWGGVCQPFEPIDFSVQDGVPLSGWPVGRDELEDPYRRAAELCNVASWELFRDGLDEAATAPSFGPHFTPRVVQRIPSANRRFRRNHRDQLQRSERVEVLLGANAIRFHTSDEGTTLQRVEAATLDGNRFLVEARAFVVATGATENARLLLTGASDLRRGMGSAYDVVGRYFLEHPRFIAGLLAPTDPLLPMRFYDWHRRDGATFRAYLALSPETRRERALPGAQFRLSPIYAGRTAGIEEAPAVASLRALGDRLQGSREESAGSLFAHVRRVAADLTRWQSAAVPGGPLPIPRPQAIRALGLVNRTTVTDWSRRHLGDIATWGLTRMGWAPLEAVTVTTILQPVPNPDSRVTLADRRDALGMPRAKLEWRLTDDDRQVLGRVMRLMGQAVGSLDLGRLRLTFDPDGSDWPSELVGGYHQMGTTRMSDDPRTGVVDRHCRVHGMSNLFIAGSSVFPTGGDGSPTLTLVALAVRLAARLRSRLA